MRYTHFRKLVTRGDIACEEILPFPAHVMNGEKDISEQVALVWINACNRSTAVGVLQTGSSFSKVVYWL